jgi:hypothetical protein
MTSWTLINTLHAYRVFEPNVIKIIFIFNLPHTIFIILGHEQSHMYIVAVSVHEDGSTG